MTAAERFWAKVDRSGECWLWTAATANGYGRFRWRGRASFAHRVVYELEVGPIPEGLQIDHLCRTRNCVNPSHLELVTQAENIRRGAPYKRKTHCHRGHPFNDENTARLTGRGRVERRCRACSRARDAQYRNQAITTQGAVR